MALGIVVNAFAGEIPTIGPTHLQDPQSMFAANCSLISGELRPIHEPELAHAFTCTAETIRAAYHLLENSDYPEQWVPFTNEFTSFIKGPLTRDLYERYYWASPDTNYLNYATRDTLSEVADDACNVTGNRVGVPRPTRAPAATSRALAAPWAKPYWDGGTGTTFDLTNSRPGDIAKDSSGVWYVVCGDESTIEAIFPAAAANEVSTAADLETMNNIVAKQYVLVSDDPNQEKNGWYMADVAGDNIPLSQWRFTGGSRYFRAFISTGPEANDVEADYGLQAQFNVWEGANINHMVNNVDSTTTTPPQVGDYIYASSPQTYQSEEDVSGWFRIVADPQVNTTPDNEDLVVKLNPGNDSEIVTRAYVYTYVNAYGEEGPPSDAVQLDGLDAEDWAVHNFDLATPQNDTTLPSGSVGADTRVPIVAIRIYRTITGTSGTADFFRVKDIPLVQNMPFAIAMTDEQRAAYNYPKRWVVTHASDLTSLAGVKHGDWAMVEFDENRGDEGASDDYFYRINKWYQATVKDSTNTITRFEEANEEYSSTLVPGQYGFVWAEQGSVFENTFIDDIPTTEVASNDALESYSWFEPPEDLDGLVLHPGGFFVGFKGRDVFYSVPYRPHAWPEEYIQTVEDDIVGLAVYDANVVILTKGVPYVASGIRPESMALIKHPKATPCLTRRGIVPVDGGVLFPSRDGIYHITVDYDKNITEGLFSEELWQKLEPSTGFISRHQGSLVAVYDQPERLNDSYGYKLSFTNPSESFSRLVKLEKESSMYTIDNLMIDDTADRMFFLSGNSVYWYDPPGTAPMLYEWVSKLFVTPKAVNFSVVDVGWRDDSYPRHMSLDYTGDLLEFSLYPDTPNPESTIRSLRGQTVDIGSRRNLDAPLLVGHAPVRLKAGFKSRQWWFSLKGTAAVEYVKISQTVQGLSNL